jgi:hypothetical protein
MTETEFASIDDIVDKCAKSIVKYTKLIDYDDLYMVGWVAILDNMSEVSDLSGLKYWVQRSMQRALREELRNKGIGSGGSSHTKSLYNPLDRFMLPVDRAVYVKCMTEFIYDEVFPLLRESDVKMFIYSMESDQDRYWINEYSKEHGLSSRSCRNRLYVVRKRIKEMT